MKIGLNTQQEQKNSKKSGKRKNKRSAKLEKMQVFEKVAKDIKDIKETEITEGIDPVLLSDNTLFDDTLDLMGNTSGDLIKDMAPVITIS